MLLELHSSEEFMALVQMLKTEGRCWYSLHAPRAKDRWLWKVDIEPPKGEKVGQMGLNLEAEMSRAVTEQPRHAICTPKLT